MSGQAKRYQYTPDDARATTRQAQFGAEGREAGQDKAKRRRAPHEHAATALLRTRADQITRRLERCARARNVTSGDHGRRHRPCTTGVRGRRQSIDESLAGYWTDIVVTIHPTTRSA